MYVSSEIGFPIRRGSQGAPVSGISASFDDNTYDVRAMDWQGAAQMMKVTVR